MRRLMTKGDIILIIAIIVISIASLNLIRQEAVGINEKYISVQVDGSEYKKITFDKNMIGKQIHIETQFGHNVIEVGDGSVKVVDADCPDKLDVHQGEISRPGEIIVCLPNRMIIEIIGPQEETPEVDYMTR